MSSLIRKKRSFVTIRDFYSIVSMHYELIWDLAKRETGERYAGQILGRIWPVLHPLMMMSIYVFIFSFVFKVKIGSEHELPLDYTAYILSGLIPWLVFQEVMAKSTGVIVANANLVKQVVFPVEVLPIKSVLSSMLPLAVSLTVLLLYVLFVSGGLPWTYVLLPVVVGLAVVLMLGVAFLLSAVGTYFRDIKDIIQVLTVINMYLMPIFYLPMWVPEIFKPVIYMNPFSPMIWCFQDALYYGQFEHPWAWMIFSAESLLVFILGFLLFRRFKTMFGNVL